MLAHRPATEMATKKETNRRPAPAKAEPPKGTWDFLTNHAHVLLCVARDPGIRLRDIADSVGITERAAHRLVTELIEAGYVLRERDGRRNRYEVKLDQPLRHSLVADQKIGELLEALQPVDRAR